MTMGVEPKTPYSTCIKCGTKILLNTDLCPVHAALRRIEAEAQSIGVQITAIFDKHRIDYEGMYEERAKEDLTKLIKKQIDSELEAVQRLCENSEGEFAFKLANAIEDRRFTLNQQ